MFKKTSRLPWVYMDPDKGPVEIKRFFNHDRITNEVNALKLVSQKTTIPVPKLLNYGVNPDGTRYLVTELINGVNLTKLTTLGCRVMTGEKHTEEASCDTFVQKAYSNAINFVENTLSPQLSTMKSQTRGIDGFVMPPAWVSIDTQELWTGRKGPWKTLPLQTPDFDRLGIRGVLPLGMDLWSGTLDFRKYVRCAGAENMAELIRKYVPEDFLEAWSQLEDREDFELSVRSGYFPDPEELIASMATPVIQEPER
ncbi:hypothetical protein H4I96_09496 [Botrytis cinerea]